MLMLGKVLKGLKSVRGGKIRAAAGAVKAGSAALGAFVGQRGPMIGLGGDSRKIRILSLKLYARISQRPVNS